MSHHFTWTDPETGFEIYVNHNGDMSGDAVINAPLELASSKHHDGTCLEIRLPAKMLAAFGRNATLSDAIAALENLIV
jgi:hypothetical protein